MSSTAARASGFLLAEPLKITSCIESPRSAAARLSPSTQRTASMTFDLPQPLGPTMPTSLPGVAIVVGSTNDLKPASLIWVRRKGDPWNEVGDDATSALLRGNAREIIQSGSALRRCGPPAR